MKSLFLSILMLAFTAGCGDLMGKKVVKKKMESERFRADCTLDVNAFTDILKRNIGADIRCLEENLNIFVKVVKTTRPGYLSRTALEQFVIKNRPDIKPEMVRAMKAIFDLNYLLTGKDPEYISSGNIQKLVEFAILFNQKAAQYYNDTFANETENTPWSIHSGHRQNVSSSVKMIVNSLRKIFNANRADDIDKLNLLDLLENFTTEDNRESMEKAKKLLFVKKLVLGGSKEEITNSELERLLLNLDHLLVTLLDAIRFQYLDVSQSKTIDMLTGDVYNLNELINRGSLGNRDQQVLFTLDDAIDAIRILIHKDDFNIDKFQNLAREAKIILMGGNTVEITGKEIKKLFNHGMTILKTGQAFHLIYKDANLLPELEGPSPLVKQLFDNNRHHFPNYAQEYKNFSRIAVNYRFFKGKFLAPYYTKEHHRNADAFFVTYALEYGIDLVFKTFGSPSPAYTGTEPNKHPFEYSMNQIQMQEMFKKFAPDLIAIDLLSPLWPTITADNVSLLGTLFQYQSDENEVMDVNEASEFGTSLLTALEMTKNMTKYFQSAKCDYDIFGRVEPACLKRNFFAAMCSEYKNYMPLMFASINTPKLCANIDMASSYNDQIIERAKIAARPCMKYTDGGKEEIWYTESDINTMLMVFLHAETTVLRWDVNNNNILDANEVMNAYPIYSTALDGFLDTRPAIIKKFKKQIYQYLVKYEEVPDEKNFKSILKFLKFIMSFNKSSSATRKTIVSVLMAIGNENKKLPTAPKIDCNLLRDPESLPNSLSSEVQGPDNRPDYSNLLEGYLNFID